MEKQELARLIRFATPDKFPSNDVVALFDATQNLLLVNKSTYDQLRPYEQDRVLRTHQQVLYTYVDA